MASEAMTSTLLRGDDGADDIIPFSQKELRQNEHFFNADPAFNSAFQTLVSFVYGANVLASRVKGLCMGIGEGGTIQPDSDSDGVTEHDSESERDSDSDSPPSPAVKHKGGKTKGGSSNRSRSGSKTASAHMATTEFKLFVSRVFPKLIVPALRAMWVDGFVAYSIEKSGEFRVPVILHPRMYVPALRVRKNRRVDLVGVKSDMKNVDASIHMFTREVFPHTGRVVSMASLLLPGWIQQQALQRAAVRMDQIAAQNLQLVESAPTCKPTDPQVSLFADADRFEADAETSFYQTEIGMDQFRTHNERVDDLLLEQYHVCAPTLKPIPPNYRLARGVYPSTRTNVSDTEASRHDLVFAACGVPKSLVMASGKVTTDTAGAYRTINATLSRIRLTMGDLFREMYLAMYPEDSDIFIEVEIDGLMSSEAIQTAGLNGFISEKDFGSIFLKSSNIPQSKLYAGLSAQPAKPESRELQSNLTSTVQGSSESGKQKRAASSSNTGASAPKKTKKDTSDPKDEKKKKKKTSTDTDAAGSAKAKDKSTPAEAAAKGTKHPNSAPA